MPMAVESYAAGGKQPSVVEATRVLVRDAHGNPILVAVEYEPNVFLCAHQGDADFDQILGTLGVEAAVVLKHLRVGG